ncbi:MAG: DMT family transporter [Propionibacteriaceae bacterium]|nr:DMT family transporter [Propionibacteriaceae bacterium]
MTGVDEVSNSIKASLVLTVTAMIWGFAFVAQRSGVEHVGPFLFNGTRCVLGAVVLFVVMWVQGRFVAARQARQELAAGSADSPEPTPSRLSTPRLPLIKRLWADTSIRGGIWCGLALFAGSSCQQVGLVTTPASQSGFLTVMYVVLVPIFGLMIGQKTRWTAWVSVAISLVGLYLLCVKDGLHIASGDLILLLGACFWTVHIIVVDRTVKRAQVFRLSCVQFLTAGVLSLAASLFLDHFFTHGEPTWQGLVQVWPQLVYVGVLSSGIGFTMQAIGQRHAPPAVAAIVMSLESVFACIGGVLLLGERMTGRESLGCALVFIAVLVAQIVPKSASASESAVQTPV